VCDKDFYRYGFNGKLKDNEWAGLGNHYDYGARNYDPRIARPISVDPLALKFPMLTPYQFFSNSPIMNIDLDGEEAITPQILQNAMNGKAGEVMFKTKVTVLDEYDVYEQVTYRPGGTNKTANTRTDFLLKSKSTGNMYSVDVKTGGAKSSTNQLNADDAMSNGQDMEMRTGKTSVREGTGVSKSGAFKLGGSVKVRIDLKTGGMKIESVTNNPNVKGSEEINKLPQQVNSAKEPIKLETPVEADEPVIKTQTEITESPTETSAPAETEFIPPTEVDPVVVPAP
jgi:RHS repeat-associated protein